MILPELNGKPREFTKNNSEALKNERVYGKSNLKTKASTKNRYNIGKDELLHVKFRVPFIDVYKHY